MLNSHETRVKRFWKSSLADLSAVSYSQTEDQVWPFDAIADDKFQLNSVAEAYAGPVYEPRNIGTGAEL